MNFLKRNFITKIEDAYVKKFMDRNNPEPRDALFIEHRVPVGGSLLVVFHSGCNDYEEAMEFAYDKGIKRYEYHS